MNELPKLGSPLEDVIVRLREMQLRDGDYHNARTWSLIYNAGPDVDAVLQAAASEVLLENALNPVVFPSLKEMQRDIVSMSVDREMHTEFAGHLPVSIEMSSLRIDDDDVGRPQQELADTSGSDQQTPVVQPNGKIARRPRHKSQTIEHSAESD